MPIISVTSREFNQDVSRVKRAAEKGPVFITDRGHPAHVLLTIEDYKKLIESKEDITKLLAMPEAANIQFEPEKLKQTLFKKAELD